MFPRIYDDVVCPIDGYTLTITLLANPTSAEKSAWWKASLGDPSCADCATLGDGQYCEKCSAARLAFGQSVMAVFKAIGGCDLTTPAACVQAIEEQIPDEVISWLYQAPSQLWAKRSEEIKKKLRPPSLNGSLSEDSPAVPSPTTSPT